MSEPAVLAWREQHHGSLGGVGIVCYPICISGVRSFCRGDAGADIRIDESTSRQFVQVFTSIGVLQHTEVTDGGVQDLMQSLPESPQKFHLDLAGTEVFEKNRWSALPVYQVHARPRLAADLHRL